MAESSKPSSGSADSYIGSLISLTSKFEIRYEGVLYSIDTEKSTIALQNVRSYGTEGRKKDSSEIPPNDKVYEYILFRGSDIKDLQVKSSPPVHTEQQIHNDPAIIQSHYAGGPSSSSTSASIAGGTQTNLSSHPEISALPRTACLGIMPSCQPGSHLGSWGPPTSQSDDGASVAMPMYWSGYYGSPSTIPHAQQQSIPFQAPSTMPFPPALRNQLHHPEVQVPSTMNIENSLVPSLIASANFVPSKFASTLNPYQFSTSSTTDVPSSLSVKEPLPSHSASLTGNLLTMTSLPSSSQDRRTIGAPISGKAGSDPSPVFPFQSLPYSASSIMGYTPGPLSTLSPALLTPDELTQQGPPVLSSSQQLHPDQKDMDALIPGSSKHSSSVSTPSLQMPLLPLPLSAQQFDKSVGHSHPSKDDDRENCHQGLRYSTTHFTEEFDFIAMNEKFKKDEVWGYLGKAKQSHETEGTEDDAAGQSVDCEAGHNQAPKFDAKPVYTKDEFFDTLSCNSLTHGASIGRTRFSERMKFDTETFGNFQQKPQLGRGSRGIGRSGNYRGSYNRGRGYGYGGRGHGGYMPN